MNETNSNIRGEKEEVKPPQPEDMSSRNSSVSWDKRYARYAIYISSLSLLISFFTLVEVYRVNRNTAKFQEYEYTPRLEIEGGGMSYVSPSLLGYNMTEDLETGIYHRSFSYETLLHNAGSRTVKILGIFLCACTPHEVGCDRRYQLALEYFLEPGDKRPIKFDSGQTAVSSLISDLTEVDLFLQIEYLNPDNDVSILRRHIGGFKGDTPLFVMIMRVPIK